MSAQVLGYLRSSHCDALPKERPASISVMAWKTGGWSFIVQVNAPSLGESR